MNYPIRISRASGLVQSNCALAVCALCLSFVPSAQAQFNVSGGAVPNWLNQALPTPYGGTQPSFATTSTAAGNSGLLTANNVGMQNWQVGIYKQDMDVGTLVKGVQANSAAARAGIKNDDLIVTVNGQQVGVTPNGVVDIGVLANQVASNGKIVALVADGLTGKLKNVTIDLASTGTKLTGQVRIPSTSFGSSYLTITLKNTTRPLYEVVGGKNTWGVSGGGQFPFELQLDPKSISPTDRYQIEAHVDDARNTPQFVSVVSVDTNRLLSGSLGYVTLDLEPYQQWLARNANGGQVVQAGYTGTNLTGDVVNVFQSIIGRTPNTSEVYGWSNFLQEGNSLNEMRIRLISHQSFYDTVGDDPTQFVIRMIQILGGRQPTANEVAQWTTRLAQTSGYREGVVRDFLNSTGNAGQLR